MIKKIKEILENKELCMHIFKYLLFGVLTTVVSLGAFWLIRNYIPMIEENIANAISIVLGIVFAYVTNRTWVFESKDKNIIKEFLIFASGRAFTFVFDMVCFYIFASKLGYNEMLVKIVIAVAVIILNYIISRLIVFKKGYSNGK